MKSGIYCIRSLSQNKRYIGQSIYIKKRLSDHKNNLSKGTHANVYLQRHFNKYGMDDLSFEILEFCETAKLDIQERYWINYYDSMNRNKGFNLESGGNLGKEFSLERRESLKGEGNPMYGKKLSPEAIELIRNRNRASSDKLTVSDVENIKRQLLFLEKQYMLAKEYNVTLSTINKIAKCKNWEWVLPELNEDLIGLSKKLKEEKRQQKFIKLKQKREWETIKEKVLLAYKAGMPRETILETYKVSNTTYVRIISDEHNRQKELLKETILNLKKTGMLNKDIAKKLNIHRTTVTEYLKKYAPEYLSK